MWTTPVTAAHCCPCTPGPPAGIGRSQLSNIISHTHTVATFIHSWDFYKWHKLTQRAVHWYWSGELCLWALASIKYTPHTTGTEDTRSSFFICPSAARECVIALFVTLREECLWAWHLSHYRSFMGTLTKFRVLASAPNWIWQCQDPG